MLKIKYSKNIFKILKTIDYCFVNNISFYEFDLTKLGITQNELSLCLYNLYAKNYINGITFLKTVNSNYYENFKISSLTVTHDGYLFLEENSTMKQLYNSLKELKDWLVMLKP